MIDSHTDWAKQQFGRVDLGDPRRTSRLIKLAATLASSPGKPIVNISHSPADMEGAYRFIRNENVDADAIAEAGFNATADKVSQHSLLLALEDTTNIVYSHPSMRSELGHINQGNRHRGLLAHSVLLFAPESSEVVGLVEQSRWTRDIKTRGKRRSKTPASYPEKESYKWEKASRNMAQRLSNNMNKVVSVCDREADIYDYLLYKLNHNQRFVVRAMMSRHIEEGEHKLFHYASQLQSAGQKYIQIAQKSGRKARTAKLDITFSPVNIKVPSNKQGDSLPVYYVGCAERDNSDSNLNWHLITNEPVQTKEEALKIVRYYEHRC